MTKALSVGVFLLLNVHLFYCKYGWKDLLPVGSASVHSIECVCIKWGLLLPKLIYEFNIFYLPYCLFVNF